MKSIEEIASQHLGKAGDGSVVKPYVTPDSVDPSLLVAVPRVLNRTQYGIDEEDLQFCGWDVWNCYEVSFLLRCGAPVSGVLKFRYCASSTSIVESKSLKLYLNSYNMERFDTNDVSDAVEMMLGRFNDDLSKLLETEIISSFHRDGHQQAYDSTRWVRLEDTVNFDEIEFNDYNESPDILVEDEHAGRLMYVTSSLLRSNCRVTNQPDWADVFIIMEGDSIPTRESLLKYIVSMRKENHFHEEICECVFTRLKEKFSPYKLSVACLYTRRGGIDINPVRHLKWVDDGEFGIVEDVETIVKTMRQ